MTRENMSRPMPSTPNGCERLKPDPTSRRNFWSGGAIGRNGASRARPTIDTIQPIASQPNMPSFFVADFSTAGAAFGSASRTRVWVPATTGAVSAVAVMGSTDCSGMTYPWVEDRVSDVNDEVHRDVPEGDDRDVTLECNVLATEDGVGDQEAHPMDGEDVLDHHCAADECADVEAGNSEQREARRPQRVTPQDARRAEPLCSGHRHEVFL